MRLIAKGATSQSVYFDVLDSTSTTGGRKTGLAFDTIGLTAYYIRQGAAAVSITLASQTASGAWTSGGFAEVSSSNAPGVYRLDIPDAAIASGVDSVVVVLKGATGMVQVSKEIQLAPANWNLMAIDGNGRMDVAKIAGTAWASGAITASAFAADAITASAIAADAIGSSELAASAVTEIQSGLSTLDAAGVRTAVGLASANLDTQLGAIAGYIDTEVAAIYSRIGAPAGASIAADIANLLTYVDTEIAAIKAKTDSLTFTSAGKIDANLLEVNSSTNGVAGFGRATSTIAVGTVGSGSSTTSVVTSALTPSATVADQFKSQVIMFDINTTTAALRGVKKSISASTSGGVLTVATLPATPASGDTFAIS